MKQFRYLLFIGLTLFLIMPSHAHSKKTDKDKEIYGRYENIIIQELDNIKLKSKLDTGAVTSSLHAEEIKVFTKDDEKWVKFKTKVKGKTQGPYEFPVVKVSKIKQRIEESDDDDEDDYIAERPVIELSFCIGDRVEKVRVNLTNRHHFNYSLLVGAQALKEFDALIDVTKKFTHSLKCDKKS